MTEKTISVTELNESGAKGWAKANLRYFLVCVCCFVLYPLSYLLIEIARIRPGLVEAVYSEGIYPFFAQPISLFMGLFPFSVIEVVICLAIVFVPIMIVLFLIKSRHGGMVFLRGLAGIFAVISAGYFLFTAGWALNYYRPSYAELEGYDKLPVERSELIALCGNLIEQAGSLREGLVEDDDGVLKLPYEARETFLKVCEAYERASVVYPLLAGNYGAPKPAMFSEFLSKLKIAGIFIPFTMEAHVNMMEEDFMIPVTACHEAAHQRGFAREDEANFIAYRVCMMSEEPYFQYSGIVLALSNSMNALAGIDSEAWYALRSSYPKGLLRDIEADAAFWKSYDTPVADASVRVNDSYLRSNGQESGVKSYGYMVDLLIAGWRVEDDE